MYGAEIYEIVVEGSLAASPSLPLSLSPSPLSVKTQKGVWLGFPRRIFKICMRGWTRCRSRGQRGILRETLVTAFLWLKRCGFLFCTCRYCARLHAQNVLWDMCTYDVHMHMHMYCTYTHTCMHTCTTMLVFWHGYLCAWIRCTRKYAGGRGGVHHSFGHKTPAISLSLPMHRYMHSFVSMRERERERARVRDRQGERAS